MKDYRVELTDTAEECLLEIGEYIALDNPVRAISFIEEIVVALQKTLSLFPHAGSLYGGIENNETIRTFVHGNYTSYYRVNEPIQRVEVLFIFNGKREITKFIEGIHKKPDLN